MLASALTNVRHHAEPTSGPSRRRRFVPLRNASFDHWSARLQASSGGSVRKTFKALNQGIAVQLQQVMADRDRLFKRIHTNRSQYRVLGTKRTAEAAGLNEEIIDDSDFYQQLLADVIEAKAASAGAARVARAGTGARARGVAACGNARNTRLAAAWSDRRRRQRPGRDGAPVAGRAPVPPKGQEPRGHQGQQGPQDSVRVAAVRRWAGGCVGGLA